MSLKFGTIYGLLFIPNLSEDNQTYSEYNQEIIQERVNLLEKVACKFGIENIYGKICHSNSIINW